MRLLNVETLELSEFHGKDIPPYTILSHRWTKDELSYQEFTQGHGKHKSGYQKICMLCNLVKKRLVVVHRSNDDEYEPSESLKHSHWVWIDTICID